MFQMLSRIESRLSTGPWWWRPIGAVISIGIMIAIYMALS